MRLTTILLSLLLGSTAVAETLTNKEVIALHQAGISAEVILEKITTSTVSFDTSTTALVALKTAGVPDIVITAMLQAKPSAPADASDHATSPTPKDAPPGPHFAKSDYRILWSGTCKVTVWYGNDNIDVSGQTCSNRRTYQWKDISAVCFTFWEKNLGKPRHGRDRTYPFYQAEVELHLRDGRVITFGNSYTEGAQAMKKDFEAGYPELLQCDETYD